MYTTIPVYIDSYAAAPRELRVVREYYYCPCCSHYSCSCSCCCSRKKSKKRIKSAPPPCRPLSYYSSVVVDTPSVLRTRVISSVAPACSRPATCVYYLPWIYKYIFIILSLSIFIYIYIYIYVFICCLYYASTLHKHTN